MTYALSGATGAAEEVPKASYSQLRLFTVPKKIARTPQADTLPAAWEICTPETAKTFSAVAYFFARDLHKALGVPVGIILSAWPGTAGEEWTDPESLRRESMLRPIVQRWEASPPGVKTFAAEPTDVSLEFDDFELLPSSGNSHTPVLLSNFDDGTSRTQTGGDWTYNWQEAASTVFELVAPGQGGAGYAARVAGKFDGATYSSLQASFHEDETPADLRGFAGVRFWVRGSGSFRFQTLQPTITDWDNYSVESFSATAEWKQITVWFKDLKQEGWGVFQPFTPASLTGLLINCMAPVGDPPRPPSGLYNGMIAPVQGYRMRGAIWYQGEGNTWRAYQYQTLLPALIQAWRKGWAEPDLAFLVVQLPNQGTSAELGDSIWAELREAQLLTAKSVPNTGLAVTIDVGETGNLHPPRKAEIGQRLALWALGTTYGRKIVYSGPLYESMESKGSEVRIHFQHTGAGLEAHGETLKGFSIAGADRKFHWANARIDGNDVVVTSPEVTSPVAVRYAWAGSPECDLYNKDGLPASPFRTDDWPGASFAER
jgi:sialate O-acetylesterase